MNLDHPLKKPVYQELALQLEEKIRHSMEPGDMLDSEHSMARDYGVNRHTIRRAIDVLIQAGMLVRQQGKGTQVLSNQIEYQLNSSGQFTKNINKLGYASHSKVLHISTIYPGKHISDLLNISTESKVVKIETVRYINDSPVCVINHHLNFELLNNNLSDFSQGSLHEYIKNTFNINLRRKRILISSGTSDAKISTNLRCALGSPVTIVKSINQNTTSKEIVEASFSYSRPDRLQFEVCFDDED